MYAVLKSVGKQFKVSPGDVLKIDKIEGNVCLLYTSPSPRD